MADEKKELDFNDTEAVNAQIKADAEAAGLDVSKPVERDAQGRFTQKVDPQEKQEAVDYEKTIKIGDKEFTFTAGTEAEVTAQVEAAYSAALAAAQRAPEKAKPEADPRVAEQEKADLQSLWIKAVGGDTAAYDLYMEKSGALDKFIEKKYGVKGEDLKRVVEKDRSGSISERWASATDEFVKSKGSEWAPLTKEQEILVGYELAHLSLANNPSKESLSKAIDSLKGKGVIFGKPATQTEERETETQVEVKTPVKRKPTSSFMPGGTQTQDTNSRRHNPSLPTEAQIMEATKNMSIEEMGLWWNNLVSKAGAQ